MAETVEQAVAQGKAHRPDIVVLDDELSQEGGVDLLEHFSTTFPDAEILLLSSRSANLNKGIGRGLLFHGLRPIASETLIELVVDALPGRLTQPPKALTTSPTVLCIDDDRQTLNSLSRLLERHGYRVWTIQDSREVMDAIPTIGPDMAIIDVLMPEVNGCELARRIRQAYRGLFPIVMHSAKASDADRWVGFRHGADYFLPKPCEPHQILDVVDYYADHLDAEERQYLESRL
jgi:DNA-binding response OmpR family regulator